MVFLMLSVIIQDLQRNFHLTYIDRAEKYWYDENEVDLLNLE